MVKSSFSGKEIPPGKGIMYIRKDGRVLYFLNRKEEKNMLKLRRKPRTVAWTEEYRREKGQRIALAQHAAEHSEETPSKKKSTKSKPSPATKKAGAKQQPSIKKAASAKENAGIPVEQIKGVGESTAQTLKAAGFNTASELAKASVDDLKDLEGIGEATAKKFIEKAKEELK